MSSEARAQPEMERRTPVVEPSDATVNLLETATALAGALTPSDVVRTMVTQGATAVGAILAFATLATEDGSLELVDVMGVSPELIERWRAIPADAPRPLNDALTSGEVVFVETAEEARRRYPLVWEALRLPGTEAWAVIPLLVEDRRLGGIGLAFPEGHAFSVQDRRYLQILGHQCSQALERAHLLQRERRERGRVEEVSRRTSFLAQAGQVLTSSLEYEETLDHVAAAAVPFLCDWCVVDLLDDSGVLDMVAVAHVDPSRVATVRELRERYPPGADHPIHRVVRSGEVDLEARIDDEALVARSTDADHLALLRDAGIGSHIVVPLQTRGEPFGAISLVLGPDERRFDESDVWLAKELAARAALAVENARLYRVQKHIAHTLQRSLLPERLPAFEGMDVAARYTAAGEGVEVGGDFYDLFRTGDGSWLALVGDVCGKGPEAAQMTGAVRHTLRTLARHDSDPARLLEELNAQLDWSQIADTDRTPRFCTMSLVRLDPSAEGVRLTVANGGHPLPILRRAGGEVEPLGNHGGLVGVFDRCDVSNHDEELRPGDAVILYTDGLLDPREGVDEHAEWRLFLDGVDGWTAHRIAEHVETSALARLDGPSRDDVALMVVLVPPGDADGSSRRP